MSTGYLPVLGTALRHGPWVAGLCAFAVTPGALVVIARVLERRWLVPHEQFAAVTYGDPLLAVTAGLGTWLTGSRTPHGLTGPAAGVVTVVVALLFGLAQWRDELRRGYYTRAQAAAPTKIWHQVVVYPVLGYWLWTAGIGGLSVAGGAAVWAGKALLLSLTGIWVATNVYDRRHPKLGHPPFDWRRARPWPRPWAVESQTLLAAAKSGLPGSLRSFVWGGSHMADTVLVHAEAVRFDEGATRTAWRQIGAIPRRGRGGNAGTSGSHLRVTKCSSSRWASLPRSER